MGAKADNRAPASESNPVAGNIIMRQIFAVKIGMGLYGFVWVCLDLWG
jgi:hypothetical protein